MNIFDLIQLLHKHKIKLSINDDKLKIDALKGAMTAEIMSLLKANKQQLISYLTKSTDQQGEILVIDRNTDLLPSFAQQRLWFIDQMDEGSAHYNMPSAMQLSGDFNVKAAEHALTQIIQRHEPLRTVFTDSADGPLQVINNSFNFKIAEIDLCGEGTDAQETAIESAMKIDAELPFDLSKDLLIRVSYLKTGQKEGVLLFNMHHIASDGWSTGILIDEFVQLYRAYITDQPCSLPTLLIQYADYAQWQRQWLTGEVLDRQLNYWDNQLADLPQVHDLPLNFKRPKFQTFNGDMHHFSIDAATSIQFKKIAAEQDVTLFMLIHAVFSLLLSRYANNPDVVIGTPVANRTHKQLEPLIGFFVNTLVLRSDCSNNPNFSDYLKQIKTTNIQAQLNQDVPFENLVDRLKPNRSTSHNALFQIMLSMDNNSSTEMLLPGVKLSPKQSLQLSVKFDLILNTQTTDDGLVCVFEYNTDLFKSSTVERFAKGFELLVKGIINNTESPISELPVLSDSEFYYLTKELNKSQSDVPRDICLHQMFEQQVKKTPQSIALVYDDQSLSYDELNKKSNQLAHYIIENYLNENTGPDKFIGLCVERSLAMVVGLLAVLKTGSAYLPLDPSYPKARLKHMISDSGLSLILTQNELADQCDSEGVIQLMLEDEGLIDQLEQYSSKNPDLAKVSPHNLAYVIYTSGSTGKPKGVSVEHLSSVYSVYARKSFYQAKVERFLLISPIAFDSSLAGLGWTLFSGGQLVIPKTTEITDPDALIKLLSRHQISHTLMTPALYGALLEIMQPDQLTALTTVVVAGESFTSELVKQHQSRLPHTDLFNEYGPTEATVWATSGKILIEKNSHSQPDIHIGKVINNSQLYVLGPNLEVLPEGVIGELYIAGCGLVREYLNQAQLTAERFIQHSFNQDPPIRLYRTGDLVRYLADGNLEFMGRVDNQVKIRGFRIELGEIEHQLTVHPDVKQAIVLVKGNGPSDQTITAYFTSGSDRDEQAITADILKSMKTNLPSYMVPGQIVYLENMPLNNNGKIDRSALPDVEKINPANNFRAPKSETELAVVKIWSKLLKIPADKISADADFFELGGHSLLTIRLLAEYRAEFKCELSVKAIFKTPKLVDSAKLIASSGTKTRPIIKAIKDNKAPLQLSYAQQRLWFIDQMDGGSEHYNMASAMQVSGVLNVKVAELAFSQIINRHQTLRTVFKKHATGPIQVVQAAYKFKLNQFDLSQLKAEQQKSAIDAAIIKDASLAFDLSSDLMLRVSYLKLSRDQAVLLFNMHHIASDGWSIGILVNEFIEIYSAEISGRKINLPTPAIQYSDFAQWQRQWLDGAVLEKQLAYWDVQLANIPQVHNLNLDFDRPEFQTFNGALHHFKLNEKLTAKLNSIASEHKVTLFMLIHAMFSVLLSRYSNATDIVIGTPMANRMQKELEPLIGFFVNTLVLRVDCSNNPTFDEFLKQVKEINLNAQENQDVPFEHLVDRLNPSRNTSYNALFQIMLNMNTHEVADLLLPEVSFTAMKNPHITALFDLSLNVVENDGLILSFEYNTDLFTCSRIESMADSLICLFTSLAENSSQKIGQIQLLNENKQNYLIKTLNDTSVDYPTAWCIHELFEQQVEKTPDNLAVVFENERLTYQQLNQRANQLAHHLLSFGCIQPDCFVGLCVERSLNMVIGLLAILKSGAGYLPLDPSYPSERLQHMLEDSAVEIVLTQAHVHKELLFKQQQVICIDQLPDLSDYSAENIDKKTIGLSADNLAYIIYTSGSTGKPKGAAVEHRNETNLLYWYQDQYHIDEQDKVMVLSAIGFDLTQKNLFAPLICGASLQFATARFYDVNVIGDFIQKNQITFTNCAPSVFYPLVEHTKDIVKLNSLRCVLFGGEAIAFDRLNKWLTQAPESLRLVNMYGPTECTDISCAFDIPIDQINTDAPIGTANHNVQLYVLNDCQQLTPLGVAGELCVAGLGVSRGYLNQAELTAEKFIANPFASSQKKLMYRTGDLVRWNDQAQLEFIGRIDNQIKIRGFRVELGEIESVLNKHPQISQSVVIFDAKKQQLNAYLVGGNQSQIDLSQLRQYLQKKLPEYMVPSGYLAIDVLPLTTHGKIDKDALSEMSVSELNRNYLKPSGEIEIKLTEIWSQLLHIDENQISADANFFESGGHSLILTQMLHLIIEQMNIQLSVKDVFHSPTVADIAVIISSKSSSQIQVLSQQDNSLPMPLSYGQYRIWFVEQLRDKTNEHNMAVAIRIKGELKTDLLAQALNQLIQQHDILRTRIVVENNTPMQVIEPEYNYQLDLLDLTNLSPEERDHQAIQLSSQHDTQIFNLSQLPLLSVLLLKIESDEYSLHFNQHHIISDGWSQQLFYAELLKIYHKLLSEPSTKADVEEFNYADYAVWQQQWMASQEAELQRSFWQGYLQDSHENLLLPIQKRAGNFDGQLNMVENHIDASLREQLRDIGHSHKGSLFNVLHSGFILLLSRLSGETDFNIGLPVTGRHVYGTQNMLGMFLNTLPVRHKIDLKTSFKDLLKQQINNVEQVLSHQDLPLEEIFKVAECERNAETTPLFQILFNMLSVPNVEIDEEQLGFDLFPEETAEIGSKFNITLYLKDSVDGVDVVCHYNNSAFSHAHIENFIAQYISLMSQLAKNIHAECESYKLNETQYCVAYNVVEKWHQKDLEDVTALFRSQAKSSPKSTAITDEFNEWSYQDLMQHSFGLSHELRQLGVQRGDMVTIVATRQANLVAGILATLQSGAAYSIVTSDMPVNRVIQQMEIVNNKVTLLCDPEVSYDSKWLAPIAAISQIFATANNPDHYESIECEFTPESDLLEQIACVTFTSGSSGIPKAVVGTHLGLCGYLEWLPDSVGFSNQDHFGMLSGLAHDPLQRDIFGALCTGAQLVIPAKEDFNAYYFSEWIQLKQVSVLHLTPAMAQIICMEEQADISSLKTVFITGEALRRDTVAALLELNPSIQILNCYGATETQRAATYFKIKDLAQINSVVPISLSTPDTSIMLINGNNELCGIGEIGMICTESDRIAKGYLNDFHLTHQKFKPLKNGRRRYLTGDLGVCLDQHNIHYMGRQDSQVNIRGFRIELGEIEYQLCQFEPIKKCTVQVHDNAYIIAYIVADFLPMSEQVLVAECQAYLEENLPQYMLPSAIIILDEMPLTANRKVDRKALPLPDDLVNINSYQAPHNTTEIALVKMWSHLLKIPEEKISIHSNFFAMGGHSLLLLKLISEIRQKFEIEMNLKYLFESKDLQSMADLIDALLEQAVVVNKLADATDDEIEEIEF